MILNITCNICKSILMTIENDNIPQEMINEIKKTCSCDIDGQTDIQVAIVQ